LKVGDVQDLCVVTWFSCKGPNKLCSGHHWYIFWMLLMTLFWLFWFFYNILAVCTSWLSYKASNHPS
jgi:hypothetical protein